MHMNNINAMSSRATGPDGLHRPAGTLAGLKVVEFAHVIAGPLAGVLMADLGATVIHVEDPGHGDPQRVAGPARDGVHLWWKVAARNKRSVTLNLRSSEGQALARELAVWADVVITNFRVETLQKWGLDYAGIHQVNPKVIVLAVSGFGTLGSRRNQPGFGKVGEAMSGVVHLTGFPDGPPIHTGFSHGDSVTGLMGAFAVQAALYRRAMDPDFDGEFIDLALYDSLLRLIEWQVIFYDQLGTLPERVGNKLAAAPAAVINTFKTADGHWITVTSGTPRSVRNVAQLVGEPVGQYATAADQVGRADHLDSLLGEWIRARPLEECLRVMRAADVVASAVYTVEDILADETMIERNSVVTVEDPELGSVRMQGVVPRMTNHPGQVWHAAPALGEDNEQVYGQILGKTTAELTALRAGGVI
jgi:crotonobetainyl-CoA:carnitine CoA-transferase CaiB-like acyl-CoA transferase